MPENTTTPSPEQFQQLLEAHNEAYKNAEEFGSWTPPAGTGYTAIVTECRTGITKNGAPYYALDAEMLDGNDEDGNSLEGNKTTVAFHQVNDKGLSGLKTSARILNGAPVNDLVVADTVLRGATGKVVRFDVTPGKTDPTRRFPRLTDLVDSTPAEGAE